MHEFISEEGWRLINIAKNHGLASFYNEFIGILEFNYSEYNRNIDKIKSFMRETNFVLKSFNEYGEEIDISEEATIVIYDKNCYED